MEELDELKNMELNDCDAGIKAVTKDNDCLIDKEKYIMYLSTVSAGTIKTLAEALKCVIAEVNMYIDKNCLKIISMDPAKVLVVHLMLDSAKFEQYYCESLPENPLKLGINMIAFYSLLKSVGTNDTFTMYVERNSPDRIGLLMENKKNSLRNEISLRLLELNDKSIKVPKIAFDSIITLASPNFQKYCRDLSVISENVIIKSENVEEIGNVFSMTANGDFASQKIELSESGGDSQNSGGLLLSKTTNTAEGKFSLKNLNLICKSCNLGPSLEIFIKNGYPLIIVFSVANLGTLKFGLAPLVNTT